MTKLQDIADRAARRYADEHAIIVDDSEALAPNRFAYTGECGSTFVITVERTGTVTVEDHVNGQTVSFDPRVS